MALEFSDDTIKVNNSLKIKKQYTNISKHKIPFGSILEPGTKFTMSSSSSTIKTERSGCAIFNNDGKTCTILVDTSCSAAPGEHGSVTFDNGNYYESYTLYAEDQGDNTVIFCIIYDVGSFSGGNAPDVYYYNADALVYSLTFNDFVYFPQKTRIYSNLTIKGGIHEFNS